MIIQSLTDIASAKPFKNGRVASRKVQRFDGWQ
jgi:hypothetical protein